MARVLAIDYGIKRIGVAVSDPMKIIANALDTVANSNILPFLTDYLQKNEVDTMVIGYPMKLNDEPADIIPEIDRFINKIEKLYPQIKVVRYDERFTSKMAFDTMIMSGISKKKRRDKALIDKISATIILENYLEGIR